MKFLKNKNLKSIFFITVIFALLPAFAGTIPPSSFVVKTENITPAMLKSNYSRFIITYDSKDFILPDTANQKIISVSQKGSSSTLEIITGEQIIENPNSLEGHLANTPLLRTDNMAIKNKAEELKKTSNPVKEISLFVYNHINNKTAGLPLISAPIIMKNRTGDCTEHAVLAAALFRGAGIPARGVAGMVFVPEFMGKKNVFVYHMWIEVFYMGRWQPVDPTRPEDKNFNTYIAFSCHGLKSEVPMSYLKAVSSLNNIRVKLKGVN